MNKLLLVGFIGLGLTACTKTTEKITVIPVERAPLVEPLTTPVRTKEVKFSVMTQKELVEKAKELEENPDPNFVIMVLTPEGYKNLANNLIEMRRFIKEQNQVIIYYRSVTSDTNTGSNG